MRSLQVGQLHQLYMHTHVHTYWTGQDILLAHSQSSIITVFVSVSLLEGHISEVQLLVFTQIDRAGAQQAVSDPPKANIIPTT